MEFAREHLDGCKVLRHESIFVKEKGRIADTPPCVVKEDP